MQKGCRISNADSPCKHTILVPFLLTNTAYAYKCFLQFLQSPPQCNDFPAFLSLYMLRKTKPTTAIKTAKTMIVPIISPSIDHFIIDHFITDYFITYHLSSIIYYLAFAIVFTLIFSLVLSLYGRNKR